MRMVFYANCWSNSTCGPNSGGLVLCLIVVNYYKYAVGSTHIPHYNPTLFTYCQALWALSCYMTHNITSITWPTSQNLNFSWSRLSLTCNPFGFPIPTPKVLLNPDWVSIRNLCPLILPTTLWLSLFGLKALVTLFFLLWCYGWKYLLYYPNKVLDGIKEVLINILRLL